MKKNKISILIVSLLFMLVLTSYYLIPIFAKEDQVTFSLELTEGDKDIFNQLTFAGLVQTDSYSSQPIEINANDGINLHNNFFSLSQRNLDKKMNLLIDRYPSFVRGKELYSENYYESNDYLVYVSNFYPDYNDSSDTLQTATITISYYNKTSKETIDKEISISSESPINYVTIEDLLFLGDQVTMILEVDTIQTNSRKVYVYNLVEQTLESEFDKQVNSQATNYSEFQNFLIDEQKGNILSVESWTNESESLETVFNRAYTVLNILNAQQKKLKLNEFFYQETTKIHSQNNRLYGFNYQNGTIYYEVITITNPDQIEKGVLSVGELFTEEEWNYISLIPHQDGLLFVEKELNSYANKQNFLIIALDTFTVDLKGQLQMETDQEETIAYFNDIYFEK